MVERGGAGETMGWAGKTMGGAGEAMGGVGKTMLMRSLAYLRPSAHWTVCGGVVVMVLTLHKHVVCKTHIS